MTSAPMNDRLFSALYDAAILAGGITYLPKQLYQVARGRRSSSALKARYWPQSSPLDKGNRKLVWVHAVSLGETRAVTALVESMRDTWGDVAVVVSSITETGHAEAKRAMPWADRHLLLPLDLSWTMRRMIRNMQPDLVVVTETDYWYHFLSAAKKQGAQLAVVNGKVSERSAGRLKKLPFISKRLLGQFDHLCVQSEIYRQRFADIGVPEQNLTVTGNIKFDSDYAVMSQEERAQLQQRLGIQEGQPVLVLGSSHEGEEKVIINACKALWKDFPNLKLVIVPRHPERFADVAQLLDAEAIAFQRYSNPQEGACPVTLVDAMGQLCQCYQLSDISIVAGSFTSKVGGHNLLEVCAYGKALVFGPHMHQQPELCEIVLNAKAAVQVDADKLADELRRLLSDSAARESLGRAGRDLVTQNQGCIQRTLATLSL